MSDTEYKGYSLDDDLEEEAARAAQALPQQMATIRARVAEARARLLAGRGSDEKDEDDRNSASG